MEGMEAVSCGFGDSLPWSPVEQATSERHKHIHRLQEALFTCLVVCVSTLHTITSMKSIVTLPSGDMPPLSCGGAAQEGPSQLSISRAISAKHYCRASHTLADMVVYTTQHHVKGLCQHQADCHLVCES